MSEGFGLNPVNLTILGAFIAGAASIVSPCVIGLFPVYLSILGVSTLDEHKKNTALVNALGFTLGFSTVFVLLGTGAGALGGRLPAPEVMRRFAGAALIAMGLITGGFVNIPFLSHERKLMEISRPVRKVGFRGAFLLGVAFSAGWSPCVGPVLAAILSIAGLHQNAFYGATLLLTYSAGMAIPFLVAALAIDRFRQMLPAIVKVSGNLRRVAGIVMVFVGILYLIGLL